MKEIVFSFVAFAMMLVAAVSSPETVAKVFPLEGYAVSCLVRGDKGVLCQLAVRGYVAQVGSEAAMKRVVCEAFRVDMASKPAQDDAFGINAAFTDMVCR